VTWRHDDDPYRYGRLLTLLFCQESDEAADEVGQARPGAER
jgi:hypothetical protein